jgi:hypothetical protein
LSTNNLLSISEWDIFKNVVFPVEFSQIVKKICDRPGSGCQDGPGPAAERFGEASRNPFPVERSQDLPARSTFSRILLRENTPGVLYQTRGRSI